MQLTCGIELAEEINQLRKYNSVASPSFYLTSSFFFLGRLISEFVAQNSRALLRHAADARIAKQRSGDRERA